MSACKELIFWQMSRFLSRKKSGSQNSGQDKGPDSSQDYDQRKQFNCEERKAGTQIPLEKYRGILVDEAHFAFQR